MWYNSTDWVRLQNELFFSLSSKEKTQENIISWKVTLLSSNYTLRTWVNCPVKPQFYIYFTFFILLPNKNEQCEEVVSSFLFSSFFLLQRKSIFNHSVSAFVYYLLGTSQIQNYAQNGSWSKVSSMLCRYLPRVILTDMQTK